MITIQQFAAALDKCWPASTGKSSPVLAVTSMREIISTTVYKLNSIYSVYNPNQTVISCRDMNSLSIEDLGKQIYEIYSEKHVEEITRRYGLASRIQFVPVPWRSTVCFAGAALFWAAFEEIAALFLRGDLLHQGVDGRKLRDNLAMTPRTSAIPL